MTANGRQAGDARVDSRTVDDFGDQWTRYTDNSGYYGSTSMLADIFGPLIDVESLAGKIVADIGSGSGRIVNMLLDAGANHVTAVEPSNAFKVLVQNTRDRTERVLLIHGPGEALPTDSSFDLIVSLGVLHHITDPAPIVRNASRALKPGGKMLVWLYGREGNKAYLSVVEPLRAITKRLPHRALSALCYILDFTALGYGAIARVVPLPLRDYINNVYRQLAPDKRRLVIYDQLNPAYAKYYTGLEAHALLEDNGFMRVDTYHRHGYSWTVIGETGNSDSPVVDNQP